MTAYEMSISDWSSDVCSSDLYKEFSWFDGYVGRLAVQDKGHQGFLAHVDLQSAFGARVGGTQGAFGHDAGHGGLVFDVAAQVGNGVAGGHGQLGGLLDCLLGKLPSQQEGFRLGRLQRRGTQVGQRNGGVIDCCSSHAQQYGGGRSSEVAGFPFKLAVALASSRSLCRDPNLE